MSALFVRCHGQWSICITLQHAIQYCTTSLFLFVLLLVAGCAGLRILCQYISMDGICVDTDDICVVTSLNDVYTFTH